jgi:chromosome segregation ATPase
MHIKTVSINGFLSYKSVAKLEELSPQHNAIVGRNGAGKSNFFNAISFVLGDDYSNMGAAARNDLLHTGAGASVVRAYVEIVFDNSDGACRACAWAWGRACGQAGRWSVLALGCCWPNVPMVPRPDRPHATAI